MKINKSSFHHSIPSTDNSSSTQDGDLTMTDLQRTVITTLYSITILVALTGNILIIFIVSKRSETRALTGFLFVNMAAADLLVTVLVMPMSVTIPYTKMKWLSGVIGEITCKVVFYSFFGSLSASIFSLTFLAVDRYLGVVLPFNRFPRLRNVKFVIAVIWLVSMILMIPAAIVYKIDEGNGKVQCTPVHGFEDLFGHFQKGVTFFYTYLFLLIYFIPLLLISLLYGLVSRKLWHTKMHYRLSSGQDIAKRRKASKKIVRTLVIVTAAFAACWLPAQAYHLIWAFNLKLHFSLPEYVMYVCLWFGHANSALNPWLYMLLTDKFRTALRDVVRGRYCGYQSKCKSYMVRENIAMGRLIPRFHNNEQQNVSELEPE